MTVCVCILSPTRARAQGELPQTRSKGVWPTSAQQASLRALSSERVAASPGGWMHTHVLWATKARGVVFCVQSHTHGRSPGPLRHQPLGRSAGAEASVL